MKRLSPEARSVLAEYRREQTLAPAARERVARALAERLASGAPGLAIEAEPPPLPLDRIAPPARSQLAVLGGVALGIGLASFAAVQLTRGPAATPDKTQPPRTSPPIEAPASGPAPLPPLAATEPTAADRTVIAEPRATIEPSGPARARERQRTIERVRPPAAPPAADPSEPEVQPTPAPEPDVATDGVVPGAPPQPIAPPPAPAEVTPSAQPERVPDTRSAARRSSLIDDEVTLLRRARAALRAGDPQRALVELAEHRWRFPDGPLADAREVARMLALCASEQGALARTEAERFLAAKPRSPFAARVRTICRTQLGGGQH